MKRSPSFDVARAIAAFHIVGLHHLQDYSPFLRSWISGSFNLSLVIGELSFFFFCSAWLLARKTMIFGISDAVQFWKRRCIRILPLFLLALLLLPYDVPLRLRILSIIGANNFLPGIAGHNIPTLWFVSILVLFYLLFPVLLAVRGIAARTVVCFAIEAIVYFGAHRWGWEPRLWWYFPSYALGLVSARLDERAILRLSLVLSAGFAMFFLFGPEHPGDCPIAHAVCGMGFLISAASALARVHVITPFFSTIAYASMAAYLFHRPIYGFAKNFGPPPDGPARLAVLFGVWIPVVFLLGWIIQRAYDRIVVLLSAWTTRMKASRRPPG